MRSIIYISSTTVLLLLFSFQSISQSLDDIYRGHLTNDLYYVNTTYSHLYYITEDGKSIEIKNSNAFWNNQYVTETTPGKIYSLKNEAITESNDYGKTFTMLAPNWSGADTGVQAIAGGEIPGLFYLGTRCYSTQKDIIFKTGDSFTNIEPIISYPLEVGFAPGEFYGGLLNGSGSYLTHTINNGVSYDTILIAETVLNDNFRFYKLSRGAGSGELFMVTMLPAVTWNFRLYHSADYGATWIEKSIPTGLTEACFTAGRGDCTFYVINKSWDGGIDYTLDIYASTDCGETYTRSTYQLPTSVGITERQGILSNIKLSPNPASDFTIVSYSLSKPSNLTVIVYNQLGEVLMQIPQGMQNTGEFNLRLNLAGLSAGMYLVQIHSGEESIAASKLTVTG